MNCPRCAESIQPNAKACPHCRAELTAWPAIGRGLLVGALLLALALWWMRSIVEGWSR